MLLQIVLITALRVLQIVLQWTTTEGGDLHHLQECKNARLPSKSRMHLAGGAGRARNHIEGGGLYHLQECNNAK